VSILAHIRPTRGKRRRRKGKRKSWRKELGEKK
jgi:hypothetical protein